MRPYWKDETRPRGGYVVPAHPAPLQRPNRTAAGMAATLRRQGAGDIKPDVLALSVRGTLDTLAASRFLERVACPCCGQKGAKVRQRAGTPKPRRATVRKRFPRRPLP